MDCRGRLDPLGRSVQVVSPVKQEEPENLDLQEHKVNVDNLDLKVQVVNREQEAKLVLLDQLVKVDLKVNTQYYE